MHYETYYAAPVYGSTKSTYTVRYLNDFDVALMKSFDANPDIVDYFQPQMGIIVTMPDGRERRIAVDFWLKCKDDLPVWVHIAGPGESVEDPIFELARAACPGKCVLSVVHPPSFQLLEIVSGR